MSFNGDNFDHGPHGFCGRRFTWARYKPAPVPSKVLSSRQVPRKWGAAWKTAVKENYLSTVKPGTGVHGSFYAYRDIYLDLDPTYSDRFGRPLMRITMDLKEERGKAEQNS